MKMKGFKTIKRIALKYKKDALVFLAGILFISIVFALSSGYKSGDDLLGYLDKLLVENYVKGFSTKEIEFKDYIYKKDSIDAFTEDIILRLGKFKEKGSDNWSGRYIAIYEKRELSLLDKLVDRPSGYELAEAFFLDGIDYVETLVPVSCEIEDQDGDGRKEIMVDYKSIFADRQSEGPLVIRKLNGDWVFSPLPKLNNIGVSDSDELYAEEFVFSGKSKIDFLSLSNGGNYCYLVQDGVQKIFVKACILDDAAVLSPHPSYYYLFDLKEEGFAPDKNWNNGKPLRVEANSTLEYDEVYEIGDSVNIIDGIKFSSAPVIGE
ncbi:MAG: hypothetical protein PHQ50_06785 [Eubacteriales bacterium]|nr:hypothetical protein [Eubacteriales bacterium]